MTHKGRLILTNAALSAFQIGIVCVAFSSDVSSMTLGIVCAGCGWSLGMTYSAWRLA